MIVAAAGNDGCECLHVPASDPNVLAVGAHDDVGQPLEFSNYGSAYHDNGIVTLGADVPGAEAGGDVMLMSGTSFAAPIVTGAAALVLSYWRQTVGDRPPREVRRLFLDTADRCFQDTISCRQQLAGRLNVDDALLESTMMSQEPANSMCNPPQPLSVEPPAAPSEIVVPSAAEEISTTDNVVTPSQAEPLVEMAPSCPVQSADPVESVVGPQAILPSACSCGGGAAKQVFAIGQLGFDFVSVARRDAIQADMDAGSVHDREALWAHLEQHRHENSSIIWTLTFDDVLPVYAIEPSGPTTHRSYDLLIEYMRSQLDGQAKMVSVPGVISGNVQLVDGTNVPKINPAPRGMFAWGVEQLVERVIAQLPERPSDKKLNRFARGLRDMLNRVYYMQRNLGVSAAHRALNYSVTNALPLANAYAEAFGKKMELDTIEVDRSQICRPESDCWDVKVYFFFPQRQVQTVRKVFHFTVDVSDIVPVVIGEVRSWFVR